MERDVDTTLLVPDLVDPTAPEGDPWAWTELEESVPEVDLSRCRVTAVLVSHDAGYWLQGTLTSLEHLTHRPDRLIAIDNESTDDSRKMLDQAWATGLIDAVYDGSRDNGFGMAVASALTQDQEAHPIDNKIQNLPEWIWLLHDDASPAPDALEQLLKHVVTEPTIDITGPKLLLPKPRQAPQQLSEVGVTISRTGRRELQLELGEIDQGQRDQSRDALGVSTCGMLVKLPVWQSLGGLDRALPLFRDGVDFGWRAHLAGYRVMTTPTAQMVHRHAGRAGMRPRSAAWYRPGKVDRQLGMLVVAAHAKLWQLPFVWLRMILGCVLHAVGYLIGKVPGRSLDEMLAMVSFIIHPERIIFMRRRLSRLKVVDGGAERVDELRPPWYSSFRVAANAIADAVADRYRSVAGDGESSSLDELIGDDFSTQAEEKPKNPWLSPIVITIVLTVIASAIAARQVWGLGALESPLLLPAAGSLTQAWQQFLAAIPGSEQISAPPWLGLVALGSTVLAGRPEWFSTLLLCAVVPLSLLTAYPVVRRTIQDRRIRLWAAFTYSLLPVLLGGTNQGRLALSVFAILLPLLVMAARAVVLRRPKSPEAWRGGWGTGLVLVVLCAFEPSLLLLAVAMGVLGAVTMRRTPRKVGRIGIALGVPLVVLAPWWPSVVTHWGRFFTGPDPSLEGAAAATSVWGLLVGRVGGAGLPPIWVGAIVFGAIWLVALIGIGRSSRNRAVIAGWSSALLALVMAILVSRLVVSVPPLATDVRPSASTFVLVAFAALILAGAIGVDGLQSELGARSFSVLQPIVVVAGALIGAISLTGAIWWVGAGMAGPIDRSDLRGIPPYILNAQAGEEGVRTLALDLSGDKAAFSVVDDNQVRLGDAERGYTFGGSDLAWQQVNDLVSRVVAGTADQDIAPQLHDLGIGYLWVRGAGSAEVSRIDNTPGLGNASHNPGNVIWQLAELPSRAVIVSGDETTPVPQPETVGGSVEIDAGDEGRTLRLGEAADSRWVATLNGEPLTAVDDGSWSQVFELPAEGGTLAYELPTRSNWWLLAQGILLVVAGVLAAPAVRRPEVRDPAKSARRIAVQSGLAEPGGSR